MLDALEEYIRCVIVEKVVEKWPSLWEFIRSLARKHF